MKFTFTGVLGGVQTARSGNTSLIFTDGATNLLVDVSGSPAGSIAACGVDPLRLTAVFLTHGHIDHIYGLPSLIHNLWLMGRREPLAIYGNSATIELGQRLCKLFSLESKPGIFHIDWETVSQDSVFEIGSFSIRPLAANHGLPTLGLVIRSGAEKVVYTADSAPIDSRQNDITGASALIHEAGGLASQESTLNPAGHSSSRQAAEMAAKIAAMEPQGLKPALMLCHLPPQAPLIESMRREAEAHYDGAVIIPVPMKIYGAIVPM